MKFALCNEMFEARPMAEVCRCREPARLSRPGDRALHAGPLRDRGHEAAAQGDPQGHRRPRARNGRPALAVRRGPREQRSSAPAHDHAGPGHLAADAGLLGRPARPVQRSRRQGPRPRLAQAAKHHRGPDQRGRLAPGGRSAQLRARPGRRAGSDDLLRAAVALPRRTSSTPSTKA